MDGQWTASRSFLDDPPAWQVTGLPWDQARAALLGELAEDAPDASEPDACPHCLADAQEAISKLQALAPGESFRGDMDGYGYVLEAQLPANS